MSPLLRHRRTLLLLLAAGSALFAWQAAGLRVSPHNDLMHSIRNPLRDSYDRFLKSFGSDRSVIIAVEAPALLSPETLGRIDALSKTLAALPGVTRVRSLSTDAVPAPAGLLVVPKRIAGDAPDFRTPEQIRADLERHPWLKSRLLSADGRVSSVVVELDPRADARAVRTAALEAAAPGFRLRVTGLALAELDIAEAIRKDQELIVPLIFGAFALLLALLMRSIRGVVLPLAVLILTLAWTLGLYVLRGHELNTVSALLAPVVMILSIEVAVHFVKVHEALVAGGLGPREAADRALRELFTPCLMTALTTIIGFLSLGFTPIPAIRLFALYASFGVLASLVITLILVPAALASWPVRARSTLRTWTPPAALLRRPRTVIAVSLLLTALLLGGLPRLVVDTNLLRILKPDAPVVEAAEFIDARLTGAHALELMIRRTDGGALDRPGDWRRIRDCSAFLASRPGVTQVFSPLDVLGSISLARGSPDPLAPAELRAGIAFFQAAGRDAAAYLTADRGVLRMSARVRAVGSRAVADLVRELEDFARGGPDWILEPTGLLAVTSFDSDRLVENQLKSLALALLLILTFIGLQFRSLAIGLIAALPNLIPIAMVYGVMAWTGIGLSTATTMISSVMLGLIVDSTILLTARWRLEGSVEGALRGAASPIAASALILAAGFAAGGLGSFPPTLQFSFLSALTLLLSAASALLVLPACLSLLPPPRTRR